MCKFTLNLEFAFIFCVSPLQIIQEFSSSITGFQLSTCFLAVEACIYCKVLSGWNSSWDKQKPAGGTETNLNTQKSFRVNHPR